MSETKNYFYLRLKENFFDSDSMILLESMKDGYVYANILLKLYLRSLKNEGRLMLNDTIPYNPEMLASVTRHSVGDIEKALKIFKELNLIEILDTGAIYITDIQSFIGKSTTEADRKRVYRERIETEKQELLLISGQMSDKCPDKTPPYKSRVDLELDKSKDIKTLYGVPAKAEPPSEQEKEEKFPLNEFVETCISYLNTKANTHYKATTPKTIRLIQTRLNEGFEPTDFQRVIDVKCKNWLGDKQMQQYLRPETLFGTKFESYLNEKVGR